MGLKRYNKNLVNTFRSESLKYCLAFTFIVGVVLVMRDLVIARRDQHRRAIDQFTRQVDLDGQRIEPGRFSGCFSYSKQISHSGELDPVHFRRKRDFCTFDGLLRSALLVHFHYSHPVRRRPIGIKTIRDLRGDGGAGFDLALLPALPRLEFFGQIAFPMVLLVAISVLLELILSQLHSN